LFLYNTKSSTENIPRWKISSYYKQSFFAWSPFGSRQMSIVSFTNLTNGRIYGIEFCPGFIFNWTSRQTPAICNQYKLLRLYLIILWHFVSRKPSGLCLWAIVAYFFRHEFTKTLRNTKNSPTTLFYYIAIIIWIVCLKFNLICTFR
jgi:hypothetical protein